MITQLVILIILILINAFFAASEIAFISLNDAKIERNALRRNAIHNQKSREILKKDHKLLPNNSFLKQCFEKGK